MIQQGDLRVWWIPQVPGTPFYVDVDSVDEAIKIITVLARYDIFQFENKIKLDYCNAGGLQIYNGKEWEEYYNELDQDIDEIMKERDI